MKRTGNRVVDTRKAAELGYNMASVIDAVGIASATAQKLPRAVTTSSSLQMNYQHRLYLLRISPKKVAAMIKVGIKHLFVYDDASEHRQIDALCVLDFYVSEAHQRQGIGRLLFEYMLLKEKMEPRLLGYDAPSPKLTAFLRKHYGLVKTCPQMCHFAVYRDYFGPSDTYHFEPIDPSKFLDVYDADSQEEEENAGEESKENVVKARLRSPTHSSTEHPVPLSLEEKQLEAIRQRIADVSQRIEKTQQVIAAESSASKESYLAALRPQRTAKAKQIKSIYSRDYEPHASLW